jgi:hypothetical protein
VRSGAVQAPSPRVPQAPHELGENAIFVVVLLAMRR